MSSYSIWPVVTAWGEGQAPSFADCQRLIDWELSADANGSGSAGVWPIDAENVQAELESRAQILQALNQHQTTLPLPGAWQAHIELLWTFWLPFAQQLEARQKALGRPLILGILGGQGTGKTTLTKGLSAILSQMGQSAATLSLDDLYLSYCDRLKLQQIDSRLVWRGPPGTHDVALGIQTLKAVRSALPGTQIELPHFDKSLHQGQGDRVDPIYLAAPSIFFFEGWFVGATPLDDALFADQRVALPNPIETLEDRQFARDMNRQLQQYQPLWALLDSLTVLLQTDYRLSYEWRLQAEMQMRAAGKECMSDRDVASFVTYFWKALHPELFITPLAAREASPSGRRRQADLVVEIGQGHIVKRLYLP